MERDLTPSQRKIFILAILLGVVFFLVWIFIVIPRQITLSRMKEELKSIQNQILEIESIVPKDAKIDQVIRAFDEEKQRLVSKFPNRDEEGIKMLSDYARKFNIEIVSLRSQTKVLFFDRDQKKVEIEGKNCYQVLVSIELKSQFKNLVQYLQDLKKTFPRYITLEKVKINKDFSSPNSLYVTVDLYLYLLT